MPNRTTLSLGGTCLYVAVAAAFVVAWASTTAVASAAPSTDLHNSCAHQAARRVAGYLVPPLAFQGRAAAFHHLQAELAYGRLHAEAEPPGVRNSDRHALYLTLYRLPENAALQDRFRAAEAHADALERDYDSLAFAVDYLLPGADFTRPEIQNLLTDLDQRLLDVVSQAQPITRGLNSSRLARGRHFVDTRLLHAVYRIARIDYEACVDTAVRRNPAVFLQQLLAGDRRMCIFARPLPRSLTDLFRPSALLTQGCLQDLQHNPEAHQGAILGGLNADEAPATLARLVGPAEEVTLNDLPLANQIPRSRLVWVFGLSSARDARYWRALKNRANRSR